MYLIVCSGLLKCCSIMYIIINWLLSLYVYVVVNGWWMFEVNVESDWFDELY